VKTNKEKLLFAVLALTALALPTAAYAACYAYDSNDWIPDESSCSTSPCVRAEWYPGIAPACKNGEGEWPIWTGKTCGYSGTFQLTKKWYSGGNCVSGTCMNGSFQQSEGPFIFDKPAALTDSNCTLE
jgi:hypothetical protein